MPLPRIPDKAKATDDFVGTTKVDYVGERPAQIHLRKCRITVGADSTVRILDFTKSEITLGSMDGNDVILPEDTVSRRHCKIVQEDHAWTLVDLGSTNGTFVDRVRVREAFLKPGCTIGLGKAEVRFHAAEETVEVVPSKRERLGAAIGRSRKMRELFAVVERIAPTGNTVIIEGETGTGKEIIAQELHRISPRADGPLVVFDCSAVPANLVESELFGHEKGAFTGATSTRMGLFEAAHGGTLFIDELGELPLMLQPKLLRALETREVRRVGGNRTVRVDVRVIAATNRDLEAEVQAGNFRRDLFFRLSVVRLRLPPLRDRDDDVPLLVKSLLARSPANRRPDATFRVHSVAAAAMEILVSYSWPGNVRELVNVIESSLAMADGEILEVEHLPEHVRIGSARHDGRVGDDTDPLGSARPLLEGPYKEAKEKLLASFERDYVVGLIKRTNGNISEAARQANIDRKYFRKLMRKYGLGGVEVDGPDEE